MSRATSSTASYSRINCYSPLGAILLNEKEDTPEITFGELEEIDEETASEIPGAGCTWYPDERPLSNEAV